MPPDLRLARSTSLLKATPAPAFVLARVFHANGAGVAACVPVPVVLAGASSSYRMADLLAEQERVADRPDGRTQIPARGRPLLRRLKPESAGAAVSAHAEGGRLGHLVGWRLEFRSPLGSSRNAVTPRH
jgi:hypothetical protein